MAGSSLLALIDDIATILDDVALLTKVAGKKTAGVVGDDLALNAEQVTGIAAERELPVVWAVAKGSLVNKAILVPTALGISAVAPWLITPLLMCGGAFLCFEGVEKIAHKLFHREQEEQERQELVEAVVQDVDLVAFEKDKIRGAVRTDFVLSAEILVIALGAVAQSELLTRILVLLLIAIGMTIGVYGLVAVIVKLDDIALFLSRRPGAVSQATGRLLLRLVPILMKTLGVAGTLAMFLVGGGIFVHAVAALHHVVSGIAHAVPVGAAVVEQLAIVLVGIVVGACALGAVTLVRLLRERISTKSA